MRVDANIFKHLVILLELTDVLHEHILVGAESANQLFRLVQPLNCLRVALYRGPTLPGGRGEYKGESLPGGLQ